MIARIAPLLSLLLALSPLAPAFAETAKVLAFNFSHADAKDDEAGKLPYFRSFPGGKDKQGRDASRTLNTLKFARGQSKLYKQEDAEPGLIVVLRRMVLVPLPEGDYRAILEGEYNAVQTTLKKETIERLLAGETTDLIIESDTTRGVRPVAFNIKAKTRLRASLNKGDLVFYGGEGRSTITHYGLASKSTFESDPISLGEEENTKPVYIGRAVEPVLKSDGSPETLPVIN